MAMRRRFRKVLLALVGIAALFVVAAVLFSLASERGAGWLLRNAVAVVTVEGVIDDSREIVETLDRVAENPAIRAVVLRVDSPGGGVAPSQEIYDAVRRVRNRKPIVASLGGLAASGGYYVASACDEIVSNPGTLTGSIGVLMQVGNVQELLQRIGLSGKILKAGKYKDIGSPLRPMTPEEEALLKELLADVHAQFIDAVASGRGMPREAVAELADGRIYSGQQALRLGLVDRLGGLREAVDRAAERAGIVGRPTTIPFRPRRAPWWWRQLFGLFEDGRELWSGGLRFLYSGPLGAG
jgi:protease-4